jgi:hypothetical protein
MLFVFRQRVRQLDKIHGCFSQANNDLRKKRQGREKR